MAILVVVEQEINVTRRITTAADRKPAMPAAVPPDAVLDKEAKSTLQAVSMILDDLRHCIKRPSFSLDFIDVSKYSQREIDNTATNRQVAAK
ncbi:hypothetical protein [Collimonas humicola]|uniref:hypothetical protein n=1 Tax=Collimonas humicola TaxID=2825886 RepID=UPI001B8B00F4|nr:hypothetical protein [Collimonas humicola]